MADGAGLGGAAKGRGPAPAPRPSSLARFVRALPRPLRRHRLVAFLARVAPGGRAATFTYNGRAWITADLTDPAPRQALITGVFDPEYFAIVRCFILPSSAVLDVGANFGFCTFALVAESDPAQNLSFHLFEANPALCHLLRKAASLYPEHRIQVHEGCVAAHPGESRFRFVPGHLGASHVVAGPGGVAVPNLVLDSIVEEAGIAPVALAKLDVEGSEPAALEGFSRSIADGRVGALFVEVSGDNLVRYSLTANDLIRRLRELGCEVFWCRSADFESGRAPAPRTASPAGRGDVRLAPVAEFPASHQTDLLAIPRNGPFGHLAGGAAW